MQDPGAMKINNFKKRCNYAAAIKVKPTIDLKTGEIKKKVEKVEDARVNELEIVITQL